MSYAKTSNLKSRGPQGFTGLMTVSIRGGGGARERRGREGVLESLLGRHRYAAGRSREITINTKYIVSERLWAVHLYHCREVLGGSQATDIELAEVYVGHMTTAC